MAVAEDSIFYKLYKLSLPKLWLDIFLPLLIGAAGALNIFGSFSLLSFFITVFASVIFVFTANTWIKFFNKDSNLYHLIYYFYFYNSPTRNEVKFKNKFLLITSIILTVIFFILTILSLSISKYLFILIYITILAFLIYIFLQLKRVDSFFDEFLIGLITGPFLISISFIIQVSEFDFVVILISLPISLLMINLRWVSQHKKNYSIRGFKVLLLFIYASFAVIFSYFNSIIYLFLFTSIIFVIKKVSIKSNNLFYTNMNEIRNFSRKFYYYNSLLLAALLIIDYILKI